MLYLIQVLIENNNFDLFQNLNFRLLNREIKQFFDNNIFWLNQIENIIIDYKYFLKENEQISYFDLYNRIISQFTSEHQKLNLFFKHIKDIHIHVNDIVKIIQYNFSILKPKTILTIVTKNKTMRSFVIMKNIITFEPRIEYEMSVKEIDVYVEIRNNSYI